MTYQPAIYREQGAKRLVVTTGGKIIHTLSVNNVAARHNTLSVAQIVAGIVTHESTTGGGNVTTDTAANIIAGSSGVGALKADGECIICYYVNTGDQILTLVDGGDVTLANAGQTIAEHESAILLFRRTGAAAVTLYIIGA